MVGSVSLAVTGRKLRSYVSVLVAADLVCALSFVSIRSVSAAVPGQQPSAPQASRSSEPQPSNGRGGSQMVPWEWWSDASVQKELGLSADKAKQIDDIFQKRSKDMKPLADEVSRLRGDLDKMTQAAVTDESVYWFQVLRVESLAARLRESRQMMLYRMYRVLQPEQNKKLQDIFDRRYSRNSSNTPGRGRE